MSIPSSTRQCGRCKYAVSMAGLRANECHAKGKPVMATFAARMPDAHCAKGGSFKPQDIPQIGGKA